MFNIYSIYLIVFFFALSASANKSIAYGEDSSSPDIKARVYQEASNLLPPEDVVPPTQPTVPVESETPSASSRLISAIWDLLPGGTSLGSSSLLGAVSETPATSGFAKWLLGDSSKENCDSLKKKADKDDSSKNSKDK